MMKIGCLVGVGILVLLAIMGVGVYNGLVSAQEAVNSQWAQVENVYQRRADLIPNLVASVKGSAQFESDTLQAVVEARSRVGQVKLNAEDLSDPQKLQQFQQAQDQLGSALSRLLVVVEQYPQLRSTEAFQNLMNQLEGSENRISVERKRFNEVAQDYNTRLRRFPAALFARLLGFQSKAYFTAQAGAETAPKVDFGAK
jgi:LemA protein